MTSFIFDLDGTLANSIGLILDTAKKAFAKLNVDIDEKTIADYVGIPLIYMGEELVGPGRGAEYMQTYLDIYADGKKNIRPFEGVEEMLSALTEAGAQAAICTSKRHQPAHENLQMMGIKKYFSAIVTCESGFGCKPDPGPALGAAEIMEAEPKDCWFIGDSVHDMACGRSAGMNTIGVLWGICGEEELRQAGAKHICSSVGELQELLLSLIK